MFYIFCNIANIQHAHLLLRNSIIIVSLICSFLSYAFTLAYQQRKYPKTAYKQRNYDFWFSVTVAVWTLLNPFVLVLLYFTYERFKYRYMFWTKETKFNHMLNILTDD